MPTKKKEDSEKEDAQHKSRETQRRELLAEDVKLKHGATDRGEENPETVPGYAGPSSTTVAGQPPQRLEKPENAVVGEDGTLTLPTEISYGAATFKKPSESDRIIGLALLEGDTFNGFHRKVIVKLTAAVTQEGAFNVFRNHNPDAIFEGFSARLVEEEEAKELVEQWRKEGAIPGQAPAGSQEGNEESEEESQKARAEKEEEE